MGELSDAVGHLAPVASPWAVDLAILVLAISVGLAVLGGLGTAIAMRFRDMIAAGATPKQVKTILDEKINGGLERIERKLDGLDEKVDSHGERLAALETLNMMAETGMAVARKRRQ